MQKIQTNQSQIYIDAHVHIIGDGSSGSGCWLRLSKAYHKFLSRIILSSLGLPCSALTTGLDELYVNKLVEMIRESSLDAAIILAHEKAHDDCGRPIENFGSFYTPNDYVLSLAKKYSDCFIPAVAIHPARADALDELERCIEAGAAMLKLLPNCQNVDCSDKRYTTFWERLAAANIPFLVHTGGELSVPVINACYSNPEVLTHPLECGVKVIAAHCGTRSLLFDPDYTVSFIKMLEKYPNLYGDNSGMNTPFRSAHFKEILNSTVQQRIVHGSDLPIPISAVWNLIRGNLTWQQYRYAHSTKNIIERDLRIKKSLGFMPETFSRILNLLPAQISERISDIHNYR